jgi:hypothetical protein
VQQDHRELLDHRAIQEPLGQLAFKAILEPLVLKEQPGHKEKQVLLVPPVYRASQEQPGHKEPLAFKEKQVLLAHKAIQVQLVRRVMLVQLVRRAKAEQQDYRQMLLVY